MARSARDVAAEIRRRSPGIGVKKLHKLLYYCQGHHLAGQGRPLFSESVSAWDMGPVIGKLWHAEKTPTTETGRVHLDEAELNTIGYVLSRYGRLSARDLEHMTHGESPWQRADVDRAPSGSAQIKTEWLLEYFLADRELDEDGSLPDQEVIERFLQGAVERRSQPARVDTAEALRARIVRNG